MATDRPRKAVYSVTETAAICRLSRARFYDLVASGVMPQPVYCVYTRRPMYPAGLAALCVRVRESSVGIDGRYIIFYSRTERIEPLATPPLPAKPTRPAVAADPLAAEMIETLRAMGVRATDEQIAGEITKRCPRGINETTFEVDLRAIFDALRCRDVA